MNKKVWIGIGVATLILLMVGVSVYRTVFAKPPSVHTVEIKEEEISSILMIPGTLELQDEQSVYLSPEKGELKEILVEEGQQVKTGDVLARFDSKELSYEIEQNKLSVESGYLRIQQLDKQRDHLDTKKKDLTKQIGKKEAEKQLAAEYDQIEMEKKLANLDLKQTLLQKDALEQRSKELEVTSLVDGTILAVNEQATPSATDVQEPILVVGSLNKKIATGLLSEYDALKVKNGQKVMLYSDALPGEEWKGEITKVGLIPQSSGLATPLEAQAVQYPITVQIEKDHLNLKPGFQLIMEIETEKVKGLVIPVEAIQYEQEKSFVFIVEKGIAKKQEIELGISSGDKAEVVNGLTSGDRIISNPSDKVTDGMEVSSK